MIKFILGLPGGGKTYFAVSKLVDLLRSDPRPIVANMEELDLANLNVYLQKLDGIDAPALLEKLIVIPKTDTFHFYRYRSGGLVLDMPPEKDNFGKKIDRETYLKKMVSYFDPVVHDPKFASGVIYFIDETHEYFNAREWGEMGRSALYYLSKHRHLHDEVYFITQAPEQVEATLKRLCNEFHCVKNHYRESFGMFKKPPEFVRSSYYSLPGPSSKPFETGSFKLDPKGIGSCYRTTGALGSKTGKAEPPVNSKKLPFWALPVGVCCFIVLIGCGIALMPAAIEKGVSVGVGSVMSATSKGIKSGMPQTSQTPGPGHEVLKQSQRDEFPLVATASPNEQTGVENGAYPTGYAQKGEKLTVFMSDGSSRNSEDALLETVTKTYCVYGGVKYYFKPAQMVKKNSFNQVTTQSNQNIAAPLGYIPPP